ncbi:MAG: hypothetical protein JWN26_341 [Candidatus Saccharibacteria bacterium]|nr:hypothetical protein [Candidatus Saccharibacteria bacterium]
MLKNNNSAKVIKNGFTVIELLVVAPIVLLVIGAFITVVVNMVGDVLASRTSGVLTYNIQDALDRIESDIKLSTTFLAQSNITLTSPQGFSDNSTTPFNNVDSTNGDMLILNTLATTGTPLSTTSGLIYLTNSPNDCTSTQVGQNTPMTMNVVYFIKNSSLWRRSIMPSNYKTAGCSVPWQQPSCNPTYMTNNPGAPTAFCATQDVKLLDNINPSDFHIQYYNTADGTTVNTVASDQTQTVAARNTALQSITTAGASITVNTTASGRAISQSGSIRATKLDVNASTIAPIITPTTPAAPTVTASLSQPASVIFTWPTVAGATGYTFQYNTTGGNCSSGSWTTAFSNQNTTTYTVPGIHSTPSTPSVIYGCATATTAGASVPTSGWSTVASVTIPVWVTPSLQNSWADFGSTYNTAGYTKTPYGLVILKGLIKRTGTFVSGETIFTLPVGYRPAYKLTFAVSSNDASASFTINTDGTITPSTNVSESYLSLESVSFLATTYTGTWTNMAMISGYSNRGTTDDPPFSYTQDPTGRLNVRGTLSAGTQTDGTIINSPALPVGLRVPLYQHFALRSGGNGYNLIGADPTGNLLAKGGSAGSAYFTNFAYLPTSYSGTWTPVPGLATNGWVVYSASYSTLQYTETSDGIVNLKGLIKSGTTATGTVIATLPAGFRPSKTVLTDSVCASLYCRIDITASGNIVARAGVSATWTSFDNISFMAEQ